MMCVPVYADVMPYGSTIDVGDLSIVYSGDCPPGLNIVGHAFLVYYNASNYAIEIGGYDVQPGEQITLGTTGVENPDDRVWYNLESRDYHGEGGYYQTSWYLTVTITLADVYELNTLISGWGEYNLVTNNCVHFAVAGFNTAGAISVSAYAPVALSNAILALKPNYRDNIVLQEPNGYGYLN